MGLQCIDWDIGDVTVINLIGRLTLGDGTSKLRQAVEDVIQRGRLQVILNLAEVMYIDSSGLGTMMETRAMLLRSGGKLKLMKLRSNAHDLIQTTHLNLVFEVFPDEDSALKSFGGPGTSES